MKKSWKTTTAGVLSAIIAIGTAVLAMIDDDPSTVADWTVVAASVVTAIGFFTAKDGDK